MMKKFLLIFILLHTTLSMAAETPLGPGDILRISVYGNPDLTTETRVSNDETISFPLIGEVSISDKNVRQVEQVIATSLEEKGFLRHPQVNIIVTDFSSLQVSVLGNIYKPGRVPLPKPTTLTDILAQAGGITPSGSDFITVLSHENGKPLKQDVDLREILNHRQSDINVKANDIVYVHGQQVSVLGHVSRPGKYSISNGVRTIVDFLSLAGGITENGADTVTLVTTSDSSGDEVKVKVNVDQLLLNSGDIYSNIELKSGDILYVPEVPKFYIYGEVNRAGAYRLEPNMTIAQALAIGGGVSLRGTENGLHIKRVINDELVTIPAETSSIVIPDDVIYIKESLF